MSKQAIGWGCALLAVMGLWATHQLTAQEAAPAVTPARRSVDVAAQRIKAALDQPLKTPLRYDSEQLNVILESLADEYDIPIIFDKAALDEVAISAESEVTIRLQNVSLRAALNLMLKEPGLEDLCFDIDDEVLLITTEEKQNEMLKIKVYQIDDLLDKSRRRFNSINQSNDYDQLIDVIVACVNHDSWQENGTGEGEVQAFSPGMIVVTQTQRVHDEVEELLSKLRSAKRQVASKGISTTEKAKPITQGFAIQLEQGEDPAEVQKQLAAAIKKSVDWSVAGDATTDPGVWLEVLPDRVLVRHFPQVLHQVALVLADMHLLNPAEMPAANSVGYGGGGGVGGGGYF